MLFCLTYCMLRRFSALFPCLFSAFCFQSAKVRKKMRICKFLRRKIARKCIFGGRFPVCARTRAGVMAQKKQSHCDFFLRKIPCLNVLRCLAVASEGTHPKGRGVPKVRKIFDICKFLGKKIETCLQVGRCAKRRVLAGQVDHPRQQMRKICGIEGVNE